MKRTESVSLLLYSFKVSDVRASRQEMNAPWLFCRCGDCANACKNTGVPPPHPRLPSVGVAVTTGSETVNVPSLAASKEGENKTDGQCGAPAHCYESTAFASAKVMCFFDYK